MGKTKKVGIMGSYGTHFGANLRKRARPMIISERAYHKCPSCASMKVRRTAVGIWECRFCGHKFTGGAYDTTTPLGVTAERTSNRLLAGK